MSRHVTIVALAAVLAVAGPLRAVDFTAQVQPIFTANCVRCHGPDKQKNQLRLDSRTLALAGGLSGRVILPGTEPGVERWSLDKGVELPVRFTGLTLGRFVLVPAMPTTGVGFSHVDRAEAIAMAERVGQAIAVALLAETSA